MFYSAKSSFLAHDTLLHYSTGLDPNATHTVTVTNEGGGTLSLLEGGIGVLLLILVWELVGWLDLCVYLFASLVACVLVCFDKLFAGCFQ